jgi:Ca2+/Na+ antiporter
MRIYKGMCMCTLLNTHIYICACIYVFMYICVCIYVNKYIKWRNGRRELKRPRNMIRYAYIDDGDDDV